MYFSPAKYLAWWLLFGLIGVGNTESSPNMLLTKAPFNAVSSATVSITGTILSPLLPVTKCELRFSEFPVGDQIDGHTQFLDDFNFTTSTLAQNITFIPDNPTSGGSQLGIGIHYYIMVCRDSTNGEAYFSNELPLQIETNQKPTLISPKISTQSPSPNISWTPVPGVPAYHVIVSDQSIQFSEESNDPTDWSIIWQAITTESSIQFGVPDPSGNFSQVEAPPLSTENTYTLAVFNNYSGESILNTNYNVLDFSFFNLKPENEIALTNPINLNPSPGDTLQGSNFPTLELTWSNAGEETNIYKVYIFSREEFSDFEGTVLVPVWESETPDTTLTLKASEILASRSYVFKVYAQDKNGFTVVSDTTSFTYISDEAGVDFFVREIVQFPGLVDTNGLRDVEIDMASMDGNQSILPALTDFSGNFSRNIPEGNYTFTFSKSGYREQSLIFNIGTGSEGERDSIFIYLSRFPSTISGKIKNTSGQNIFKASINARNSGGEVFEAVTDGSGAYRLGLPQGNYTLWATHPDYFPSEDSTLSITTEGNVSLSSIELEKISTFFTGNINNENGTPLSGAEITITGENNFFRQSLSDETGFFSFPLLAGTYIAQAVKTGFTTWTDSLEIIGSTSQSIVLRSGAKIIKGRVGLIVRSTDAVTTTTAQNATVSLTHVESGNALTTVTSKTGDFSFSISQSGDYSLRATKGGADPDEAQLAITTEDKIVEFDLNLKLLGQIQGTAQFSPDSPEDPSLLAISLRDPISSEILETTFPKNKNNQWTFSFSGIPDGNYHLSAAMEAYGSLEETPVSIVDRIWVSGTQLTVFRSDKKIAFSFFHGTHRLAGQVETTKPFAILHDIGDTLFNAPFGEYHYSSIPDSSHIIPLISQSMTLDTASAAVQEIVIDLPFIHIPPTEGLDSDSLELQLSSVDSGISPDSGYVVTLYRNNVDTIRLGPTDSNGVSSTYIPLPRDGGELKYFFVLHRDSNTYSNGAEPRWFRINIPLSEGLNRLSIFPGTSIYLSVGGEITANVKGWNQLDASLDSALGESGSIQWSTESSAISLSQTTGLQTTLTLEEEMPGPSVVNIRAILEGDTVSEAITVNYREGTINSLSLSSSLASKTDIYPGDRVEFFPIGLDTLFTPPRQLSGNFNLSLIPPEAGLIENNSLVLDSNFIGPLRVIASYAGERETILTELGAQKDSLLRGLNVGQLLRGDDSLRILHHGSALLLTIPDSSLAPEATGELKLYQRTLSHGFTSTREIELSGSLYEITSPTGTSFERDLLIGFAPPPGESPESYNIGVFDEASLSWIKAIDTLVQLTTDSSGNPLLSLGATYFSGHYYGLLASAKPLSASGFSVTPNPFSPLVLAQRDGNTEYGTRIEFKPHSNKSDLVTISLSIYNMKSELVRTLEKFRSTPKTTLTYYWDGKTDSGSWARNGRYLIVLLVRETVGNRMKRYMKPVVLFK